MWGGMQEFFCAFSSRDRPVNTGTRAVSGALYPEATVFGPRGRVLRSDGRDGGGYGLIEGIDEAGFGPP
jgi:hypothetical protein